MSTETEPTTKTIILALEVPDTTKVPVAPDYALRAMAYGIMQTFDAKTLPGWDGPLLVLDGEDERDARAVLGVLTRRRRERLLAAAGHDETPAPTSEFLLRVDAAAAEDIQVLGGRILAGPVKWGRAEPTPEAPPAPATPEDAAALARHERARKGGEAVVAKYGPEHMGAISKGRKPTPRYTPTKS